MSHPEQSVRGKMKHSLPALNRHLQGCLDLFSLPRPSHGVKSRDEGVLRTVLALWASHYVAEDIHEVLRPVLPAC